MNSSYLGLKTSILLTLNPEQSLADVNYYALISLGFKSFFTAQFYSPQSESH